MKELYYKGQKLALHTVYITSATVKTLDGGTLTVPLDELFEDEACTKVALGDLAIYGESISKHPLQLLIREAFELLNKPGITKDEITAIFDRVRNAIETAPPEEKTWDVHDIIIRAGKERLKQDSLKGAAFNQPPVHRQDLRVETDALKGTRFEIGPYYFPDSSELRPGFECEYFTADYRIKPGSLPVTAFPLMPEFEMVSNPYWRKVTVTEENISYLLAGLKRKRVRVKRLDGDSIVDCGWRQNMGLSHTNFIILSKERKEQFALVFSSRGKACVEGEGNVLIQAFEILNDGINPERPTGHRTIFQGHILNPSELQFQMKRIGITK